MRDLLQYPFEVRALPADEGGGYLISFPDFDECISDGETPEEAIRYGMDALRETIAALEALGLDVPEPGSGNPRLSYLRRMPKSLQTRLVDKAKEEGVDVGTLVTVYLAEGLARYEVGSAATA